MFIHNASSGGSAGPKRVKVFGERCSGTNYASNLLYRNLTGVKVKLHANAFRQWKHGFVRNPPFDSDILVVFVVRNPVSWLKSFHRTPWHAPRQYWGEPFPDFLRREWESRQYGGGHDDRERMDERHPDTGARFRNVLELRSEKLRDYRAKFGRFRYAAFARYEDVREAPEAFIDAIGDGFGLSRAGTFDPVESYKGKEGGRAYKPKTYAEISDEDEAFIRAELDPGLERWAGYDISRIGSDADLRIAGFGASRAAAQRA